MLENFWLTNEHEPEIESCKGMNFATLPYCFFPYPSPTLGHNVHTLYPTLPYPNKLKTHNNRILCMISLFSYELMKVNTADI